MASRKKLELRVQRLRDQVQKEITDQKHDKAVQIFEELIALEPNSAEWPRRAADSYWYLKENEKRLLYSVLAAKIYAQQDEVLKAIAMCKVVLSIDPEHAETQQQLAELNASGLTVNRAPTPNKNRRLRHGTSLAELRQKTQAALEKKLAEVQPETAAVEAPAPAVPRLRGARALQEAQARQRGRRTQARLAAAAELREVRLRQAKLSLVPAPTSADSTPAAPPKSAPPKPAPRGATPGSLGHRAVIPREDRTSSRPGARSQEVTILRTPPRRALGIGRGTPAIQRSANAPSIETMEAERFDLTLLDQTGTFASIPAPAQRHPSSAPLERLSLSIRVGSVARASIPPLRGGIYSLTLDDILGGEFQTAQIPRLAPRNAPSLRAQGPLIIEPTGSFDEPELEEFGDDGEQNEEDDFVTESIPPSANFSLENTLLFGALKPDVLQNLMGELQLVELAAGQSLYCQGDTADAMYVIVEGALVATVTPAGHLPIELAHLEEGEFFGEIGLLSDQPRQASVTAKEAARLLRFDRKAIKQLMESDPHFLAVLLAFLRERLVEGLMTTSPLFAPFAEVERVALANRFEFLEIEPDSLLLDPGQRPVGMYVLLTGEALCTGGGGVAGLLTLGPGDIFGERALLNNATSELEVVTLTKCFALCLPSQAFFEVIMTHPTVLEYISNLGDGDDSHRRHAQLDHIAFF